MMNVVQTDFEVVTCSVLYSTCKYVRSESVDTSTVIHVCRA